MGTDCSNCKCTTGEEEKILLINDVDKTMKDIRKQKLETEKQKQVKSVGKAKRQLTKEMLLEILDYNPDLEGKIVKIQSLIRKYKCQIIYKMIRDKIRSSQKYFKYEEFIETINKKSLLVDILQSNNTKAYTSYTYNTGSIYNGSWLGGFRHGYGKMVWLDGSYYEGNWNLGYAEGEGSLYYSNGNYMKGEFRYNKLNGKGESYSSDKGYKYNGFWMNDVQTGQGIETWLDGSEYLGLFLNGNKEKFGKYNWDDGSYYIGEWRENKTDGYVSLLYLSS